nr:hypothetical protein [Tanacetum cinerariifolium]
MFYYMRFMTNRKSAHVLFPRYGSTTLNKKVIVTLSNLKKCNPLSSGISSLQQRELSSLAVGTSSGSGNLLLAVGIPYAFYS